MVLVIETHRACPLAGPHNGYEASRGVSSLQLGRSWTAPAVFALHVESQLPSEKQILRDQGGSGTKQHTDKIANDQKGHREGPNHSALPREQRGCRGISKKARIDEIGAH